MSLSALPEWKQMLLERKRKEEEERERREREEEERLASMPAWKREIIQRRKEKERERDIQRIPDVLASTEDIITEHLPKVKKQISKETIQQNPFIRSENSFRRDKRVIGENAGKKAGNKSGRDHNKETEVWRGQDRESKNEGRERERSAGRESKESAPFSPVVGLRTIQANNIIIIEKDKSGREKVEKEVEEDEKRMRMDLREFLAGGGSVTEIRASEVLIIKPPVTEGKRDGESGGKMERGRGDERGRGEERIERGRGEEIGMSEERRRGEESLEKGRGEKRGISEERWRGKEGGRGEEQGISEERRRGEESLEKGRGEKREINEEGWRGKERGRGEEWIKRGRGEEQGRSEERRKGEESLEKVRGEKRGISEERLKGQERWRGEEQGISKERKRGEEWIEKGRGEDRGISDELKRSEEQGISEQQRSKERGIIEKRRRSEEQGIREEQQRGKEQGIREDQRRSKERGISEEQRKDKERGISEERGISGDRRRHNERGINKERGVSEERRRDQERGTSVERGRREDRIEKGRERGISKERGINEKHSEKEGIWSSMQRVLGHRAPGCSGQVSVPARVSGRVSQLLSKFGENPKPPLRSKSTESLNQPDKTRARYSTGDLSVQDVPNLEEPENSSALRGVPKRSFSFSDRVIRQQENRDFKVVERTYSDRRVKTQDQSERQSRRYKDDEENRQTENRDVCGKTEDEEEGFTVASIVKNPEEVAFARRIPNKHEERDCGENREENEAKIDKEMHRDKRQEEKLSLTEFQNDSERRLYQDQATLPDSRQSHGIYIPPSDDSTTDISADIQCQCSVNTANTSCPATTYSGQQQAVLTQHTEDLLCKLGKIQSDIEFKSPTHACSSGDSEMISDELSFQEHQDYENFPKQESCYPTQLPTTLSQSKLCTQEGITIPRTVFYGVDISAKIRRSSLPARQEGGQTERRGSWKTGRPLTRVESLKEKIRQQEKETQRSRHDGTEATTSELEETTVQTLRPLDVTQEVSMAKSSPQLPVPDSLSLLQSPEREVVEITSKSDICGTKKRACNAPRTQDFDGEDDRIEREEELLEEEYFPPSLSPSPTLSESLDTMSRIYNLKTVGSRTTVCIGERTADVSPHGGLQGKYNPIRQAPSPDVLPEKAKVWNHGKSETVESTGVQMVQHQVERLQLQREPEEACGFPKDRKSSRTIVEPEVKIAEGQKRPDILRETQISTPRFQPQLKVRSFTINAQNSAKPPEQISPSSSAGSPSSSTPSPPLFSIRSASGGPSKRGTTITITPRRPAGSSSPGSAPTVTSPTAPKTTPQTQTPTPAPISTRETGKKRYPTAEEIQVIGGYQNLERSCLVKSRGTPKSVKVCFDEAELERVCEYPSEDCVLASLPCFPQSGPEDGDRDEQEEDDEDEESSGTLTNPSDINVCTGRTRFLKVDESCKRLSK